MLRLGVTRSGATMKAAIREDMLLSEIAQAIGEPARTRILLSLLDGHARTSTELAALAEVGPSTASAHLNRLMQSRLIRVEAAGRHRYYSLRGPEVARVLETLSVLAARTTEKFLPSTPEPLRRARTCYDHMAGTLAVVLHERFVQEGWIVSDPIRGANAYEVSETGAKMLDQLDIDLAEVRGIRRRFAYACLDWSERRPHIAGALGAALLHRFLAKRWVVRDVSCRALRVTRLGEREIPTVFGVKL